MSDYIVIESDYEPTFELTLLVRDSQGNPTSKKKTFKGDSAEDLWKFYMNNKGKPRHKKRRNKTPKNKLPKAKEADKIMKDMYKEN